MTKKKFFKKQNMKDWYSLGNWRKYLKYKRGN